MKASEFWKESDKERRIVSKDYGWKQSSYINYKVENGYFFTLFCYQIKLDVYAELSVKPMYADNLWWEIFEAPENRNAALSLRGNGAFSVRGALIAKYEVIKNEVFDSYSAIKLYKIWHDVFTNANSDIQQFLEENPNAQKYIPTIDDNYKDSDRLLWLVALLHNGRKDEVVEYINNAKKNGHRCLFEHHKKDSYDFILKWCMTKFATYNSDEIKIYHSIWKTSLLLLVCILFTALAIFMYDDVNPIISIMTILFFGGGGMFMLYLILKERFSGSPYILITNNYVRINKRVINFNEIDSLNLIDIRRTKIVGIVYKSSIWQQKYKKMNWLQRICAIKYGGAYDGIPISYMTMKANDIYAILCQKLDKSK